jgi:hypothetical protein
MMIKFHKEAARDVLTKPRVLEDFVIVAALYVMAIN